MTIEAQNEEPEIARNKYKVLTKFQVSKEWEWIVKAYEIKANVIMQDIKKEFSTRKKAVVTNTECEKLNDYILFLEQLIEVLPKENEGANVFADELREQIQRGLSHVYAKVEIGFDTPMFTKLDMMKNQYNAHMTVNRKLTEIVSLYLPKKEESVVLDPYED